MKIGILSFAHMHAYSYATALQETEGVELTAVFDEDVVRGKQCANHFHASYFDDYERMLQSDLDAVIVCSENVKHKQHVIAAAQAGKHILCEKPIATTIEDAREMIREVNLRGVKLEMAFPVRFSPPVREVKKLVDTGKLGRMLAMQGTNRGSNPGDWFVEPSLSGGGAVLDHTVHIIDVMRWYVKAEVKAVFAEIDTKFSSSATDDCGILLFEFTNGVIASHDPSWSRPKSFPTWGDITLKLTGTEGVVAFDALAQKVDVYRNDIGRHVYSFWGDAYDLALIQNFVHTIKANKAPFITGEDGLRALQVALSAYESAKMHQPVQVQC